MIVLVLGGTGFVGRHVVAALAARGHVVIIGTRHPSRRAREMGSVTTTFVEARFEALTEPAGWRPLIAQVEVVVNCVGILRERGEETYERIHDRAPERSHSRARGSGSGGWCTSRPSVSPTRRAAASSVRS